MQVTVQRLSPVEVELEVLLPVEAVKNEFDKAYSTLQKRARVRGFRPGKAPRQVLTRLFGPQVMSDVLNQLVNDALPKVLVEKTLVPVSEPAVKAETIDPRQPFSFKARFEVTPDIADVKYEGFELDRPVTELTDAMVDAEIERIRKTLATLAAPAAARNTTEGDVVTIDFTLEIEGKKVQDGGGTGVPIELGAGQVLPELDAALRGKPPNVPIEVELVFPTTHPREAFRGKHGKFAVKITDIQEKVLPALDEEMAKRAGAETLIELRANTHTRLEKAVKERAELSMAEQIVDKLNALNPVDVPPSLVEQQRRMMEAEVVMNARRMGRALSRSDLDALKDSMQKDAQKKVRAGLLMAAIARKLEMKVTETDLEAGMKELAEETGKNIAKLRVEYREKQKRDMLVGMILEDKILDFIEGKSKITDKKQPAETK